jgi:hypothetical protein
VFFGYLDDALFEPAGIILLFRIPDTAPDFILKVGCGILAQNNDGVIVADIPSASPPFGE